MSNFSEVISSADIVSGLNYQFLKRSNNESYAINLSSGYLRLPSRAYFFREYTLSFYVKWNTFNKNSRIFDFNNGTCVNSISFNNKDSAQSMFQYTTYFNTNPNTITTNLNVAQLGSWNHFVVLFDSSMTRAHLYINALKTVEGLASSAITSVLTNCHLGKSCLGTDALLDGAIDDIKIYEGKLGDNDILLECIKLTSGFV